MSDADSKKVVSDWTMFPHDMQQVAPFCQPKNGRFEGMLEYCSWVSGNNVTRATPLSQPRAARRSINRVSAQYASLADMRRDGVTEAVRTGGHTTGSSAHVHARGSMQHQNNGGKGFRGSRGTHP